MHCLEINNKGSTGVMMQTETHLKDVMSVKRLANFLHSGRSFPETREEKGENKYQLSCYQPTEWDRCFLPRQVELFSTQDARKKFEE